MQIPSSSTLRHASGKRKISWPNSV
uniref:Uncharacterized protein n=1 Tax=Arundo donax TaxID=35708 RepID=A0A0A8YBM0_ARUDO